MANNIRGLTIEVSADGAQFKKTMTELRKDAKSSQTELNALQKSLELKFDDKKFARAQKVAQEAIDATAREADALRQRLERLKASGKEDTPMFRSTQSELAQVELKTQKVANQFEKINNLKLDNLSKQITNVGDKITGVGKTLTPLSAGAAAALAGLGALGGKAVNAADEISTLSTQYDMSAEAMQKFNYVALQTDTASEDLYKGFVKVRSGIADIASGTTSTASAALQGLNIDLNSFDGSEEQFYAIIDSLASMEDKTQMVAAANDIFGDKLANNLLPLIYSGSDAISQYSAEYENLGALSNEQVAALAEFDNVLNTIKTQLSNVALQIGASLLPIMKKFADVISKSVVPKLQQLAEWFNNLSTDQQEFMIKALAMVAGLAPVILIIGKLAGGIGSMIGQISNLKGALDGLSKHPIIAIIGVIALIIMLLYSTNEQFRESINALIETIGSALQPVLNLIMGTLQTLMGLLSPLIDLLGNMLATVINIVIGALQPFFDMLSVIFELIQPLIQIALIPLQVALSMLQVPLQLIGSLLGWLAPLFTVFANIVKGAFSLVLTVINIVLGAVENAINWCIDKINSLIDGVNSALGWLGVSIGKIGNVSLKIKTEGLDNIDDIKLDTTAPPAPDNTYDKVDTGGTSGDIYNNDYSNNATTQNVTVIIQNYAEEVDLDKLVREINIKLAEAM